MRKCNFVLSSNGMPDNDLIDIVELIPILIKVTQISVERLELWTSWNSNVESFSSEERFEVEQIKIVFINDVRKHLIGETVQVCHNVQWKVPLFIGRTVHLFSILQGLVIIEPIINDVVFLSIQLHINWLQRLHLHYVVSIVQRRLLVIKRRESHSFKMSSISFLTSHHNPHRSPLGCVDGLNHSRNFIYKADSSSDMIENLHSSDLFPRHWCVFE